MKANFLFFILLFAFIGAIIGFYGYIAALVITGMILFLTVFWIISKKPVAGIYLIAFSLPFERIGAISFGGINVRLSQVFLAMTLLAWLCSVLLHKKKILLNPSLIWALAFVVSGFISSIFSIDTYRSITIMIFTFITILLAFSMNNLLREKEEFIITLKCWIGGSLLAALFGYFQFIGDMLNLSPSLTGILPRYDKDVLGFTRVHSTFPEPLYYANYLLPILIILILAILRNIPIYKKQLWFVLLLIANFGVFLLAFSKGGILALGVAIFVLTFFQAKVLFRKESLPFLLGTIVFLSLIVVGLFYTSGRISDFEKMYNKVVTIVTGGTISERAEATSFALDAFNKSPLFGIGPGSFGSFFTGYSYEGAAETWPIVNNQYLELVAEYGVLGAACFLIFIFWLIFSAIISIKETRDYFFRFLQFSLVLSCISILVQYLTYSTIYIMQIWFLFGMIIAVTERIRNDHKSLDTDIL